MPGLLAHGSGIDDLIVAVLIVVGFVLLSRHKARADDDGTREAPGGGIDEPPRSSACLYCGEPVPADDERCPACGYAVVDGEER